MPQRHGNCNPVKKKNLSQCSQIGEGHGQEGGRITRLRLGYSIFWETGPPPTPSAPEAEFSRQPPPYTHPETRETRKQQS